MPPKRKRARTENKAENQQHPSSSSSRSSDLVDEPPLTIVVGYGSTTCNDGDDVRSVLSRIVEYRGPRPFLREITNVRFSASSSAGEIEITSLVCDTFRAQCSDTVHSVIVGEGITAIEGDDDMGFCFAFPLLTMVQLPTTLKNVSDGFLNKCTSLTSIELPSGLVSLGDYALCHCISLTSITLPDTLTSLGHNFLHRCVALTSLELPVGLTSVGTSFLLGCSSLRCLDLPAGLTAFSHHTLFDCTSLTSVRLPSSLTTVGHGFLDKCSSLVFLDLPDSLTSVGQSFLKKCDALQEVHVSAQLLAAIEQKQQGEEEEAKTIQFDSLVNELLASEHRVVERYEDQK